MRSELITSPVSIEVAAEPRVVPRSERAFRLGYQPCLDGLRAFAVLVVMARHAYLPFFKGGQIGVDVFFVLSGFLITSLLLQEWEETSAINLRNFYGRRLLRLLPALLVLLLVAEGYALLRLHGAAFLSVQKAILAALCYAANWMQALSISGMGDLAHTWSLSIEEQFYVLWPPILVFLLPRLKKNEIFAVLLLIATTVAWHRSGLWIGEGSYERIYDGTDSRFDELLVGCAAALMLAAGWLQNRGLQAVIRYAYLPSAAFIAILVAKPMSHQVMSAYGWILIELSLAFLLCWFVTTTRGFLHDLLEIPPSIWIGRISYGLYLWHYPIFCKVGGLRLPSFAKVCLMFAVTFAVAVFSHYYIERPFLRLKSRLKPCVAPRL